MSKRAISYALLFTLVISIVPLGLTYADNERNELNQVQRNITNTQQVLDQGKREEQNLIRQIQNLEGQMRETQAEINAIRGDIEATQAKIREAQADLDKLEAELGEQNDNLNARLRAMYMNGSIGVLDVLLGSNSISDFMTNMDRVQLIYESDVAVIESLQAQHQIIETQRQYLNDLEAELVAERQKEASRRDALKQNQDQVSAKKTEVAENNKLLSEYIDALNAEADRLIAIIFSKQSDDEFVGGDFRWPVPGVRNVTSEYGYRIHPILKSRRMHTGLDIGAPTGTRVVASNSGRVITAGWNNSYGWMIVIDHGGGISTLYAHHSENLVKEGDIVTAGQQIARVGSTGMSTGPHLHFEVRVNGQHKNPREYL